MFHQAVRSVSIQEQTEGFASTFIERYSNWCIHSTKSTLSMSSYHITWLFY